MKKLGDVVIRTHGRVVSDQEGFFSLSIMQLFQDDAWRIARLDPNEAVYVGPYCYTRDEIDIPF